MNQTAEPLDVPGGRLAEAIVLLDGSGWIGWTADGKLVRLDDADLDDLDVLDALIKMDYRPEQEQPDGRPA
jgi:hypothetical protein